MSGFIRVPALARGSGFPLWLAAEARNASQVGPSSKRQLPEGVIQRICLKASDVRARGFRVQSGSILSEERQGLKAQRSTLSYCLLTSIFEVQGLGCRV